MGKKSKKEQKTTGKTSTSLPETRQALMLMAKDKGVKNFRVLNKMELERVLADDAALEQIQEVVAGAVSRWKAGWGARKGVTS